MSKECGDAKGWLATRCGKADERGRRRQGQAACRDDRARPENSASNLQGLLDSPGSRKSERLRAAELLMKCPPEPSSRGSVSGQSDSDPKGIETIICIP